MELKNLFCLYTKHGTIKKIALLCFCSLFVYNLWGQEVSIYGKVIDKNGERLGFATIILTDKNDSLLHVTISDSVGNYLLASELSADVYYVKASFVGMEDYIIPINIEEEKTTYLHDITLIGSVLLDGVVVTARRQVIKQYADKIEVNINNDVLNTGNSALEVLQRAPGVAVDKQSGTVKLMGKDALILIDGRDIKMPVINLLAMLESTPSENLMTIELMTTPPAQYDAEGRGGVINIKMKRNEKERLSASMMSGLGYSKFLKYREGASLYYSKEKITLYGGLNYVNEKWSQISEESFALEKNTTHAYLERVRNNPAFNYRFGTDYLLNHNNRLGLSADGFINPDNSYIGNAENNIYNNSQLDSIIINEYALPSLSQNIHSNLYYIYTFNEKSALKTDIDYLYNYGNEKNNYIGTTYNDKKNPLSNWTLHNPSQAETQVIAFRADYYSPIGKSGQLVTGLKSSLVDIDYQGSYLFTQNDEQQTKSNLFDYAEQNYAAHVSWSDKIGGKFNYKMGLRSEYTQANADSEIYTNLIDTSYFELFPSLFLMYQSSEKHTFKLAYNKRINRPSYRTLNPFEYYISQLSIIAGTPTLSPSITHNIEIGHVYNNSLTTNLFYMYNTDVISQIVKRSESVPNTVIYFRDNIGKSHEWGFFTGGYKQLLSWWGVYAHITAYYTKTNFLILEQVEKKEQFQTSTSISSQFFLPKNIKIELSGYAQSPEIIGFYKHQAFYTLNFNAAKTFGKKQNFTLSLKINDLLDSEKHHSFGTSDNIRVDVKNSFDSRQFWLTALWKFGHEKEKNTEKRNSIEEEQKRM